MAANAIPGTKGFVTLPWEARFWMRVEKSEGCWNWVGGKTSKGYGQLSRNGRVEYAHRLSFELAKGPIPIGTEIDHVCRNPGCVNPAHLDAVTHQENMRRVPYDQRGLIFKTHCKRGHELSGHNGRPKANGSRQCRECSNMLARERRAQARGDLVDPLEQVRS